MSRENSIVAGHHEEPFCHCDGEWVQDTLHYRLLATLRYNTGFWLHYSVQASGYSIEYRLLATVQCTGFWLDYSLQASGYSTEYRLLATG